MHSGIKPSHAELQEEERRKDTMNISKYPARKYKSIYLELYLQNYSSIIISLSITVLIASSYSAYSKYYLTTISSPDRQPNRSFRKIVTIKYVIKQMSTVRASNRKY